MPVGRRRPLVPRELQSSGRAPLLAVLETQPRARRAGRRRSRARPAAGGRGCRRRRRSPSSARARAGRARPGVAPPAGRGRAPRRAPSAPRAERPRAPQSYDVEDRQRAENQDVDVELELEPAGREQPRANRSTADRITARKSQAPKSRFTPPPARPRARSSARNPARGVDRVGLHPLVDLEPAELGPLVQLRQLLHRGAADAERIERAQDRTGAESQPVRARPVRGERSSPSGRRRGSRRGAGRCSARRSSSVSASTSSSAAESAASRCQSSPRIRFTTTARRHAGDESEDERADDQRNRSGTGRSPGGPLELGSRPEPGAGIRRRTAEVQVEATRDEVADQRTRSGWRTARRRESSGTASRRRLRAASAAGRAGHQITANTPNGKRMNNTALAPYSKNSFGVSARTSARRRLRAGARGSPARPPRAGRSARSRSAPACERRSWPNPERARHKAPALSLEETACLDVRFGNLRRRRCSGGDGH